MAKICVEFDPDNGGTPTQPVRSYGTTIGDGTSTEFDIAHDLNTRDAYYTVRNITTGEINNLDHVIDSSDPNTAVIRFDTAPAAGSVRVSVLAPPVVAPQ